MEHFSLDRVFMNWSKSILALGFISVLSVTEAVAGCQISDAKLEEALLNKQEFRGPANRQKVRDLRSLRDAAFTLWSYGLDTECERLVATIRELVTGPPMGNLGGNDEEDADKQIAAREHKVHRETAIGHRDDKGAKPLIDVNALALGLRMDEMIGAQVRSSDDKIVGEVRNIVFETKDRRDYAIVASGGFFTPGTDSYVVPIRFLKVSQEGDSFFLAIPEAKLRTVPLMPDQEYKWLSDEAWRTRNDAFFEQQRIE
jgi:sporulation protein YlmC with PRC-barrel domain